MSTFARHHKELKVSVANFKGQTLTAAFIKTNFSKLYPNLDVAWVLPSDHCANHICKGACECAKTPNAIFERVARVKYLVL